MAGGEEGKRREVGRLEWIVGALGAAITAGVLGTLAYEASTYEEGPLALVVRMIDVTQTEGGFVVRFAAANDGTSTAGEVVVRATLKEGDRTLEQAARIDALLDGGTESVDGAVENPEEEE